MFSEKNLGYQMQGFPNMTSNGQFIGLGNQDAFPMHPSMANPRFGSQDLSHIMQS